jgi:O-antigen biosynthesis protein
MNEMTTGTSPTAANELYDAAYYAHHCGGVYERNDAWTSFFGSVAEHIIADLTPATVLDVGCALGFLVEALRDRGIEAYGIDISEFAIAHARDDMKEFVTLGSALEPFGRRYDLITCIEVLEHLSPAEAQRAVANICAHTDHVLFTSTPHDYSEETHINVRQPEYWTRLFARHGLFRDVDYDASYLVPWATHYRRSNEPVHEVVSDYDRVLWLTRHELDERNKVVLSQMRQADESRVQEGEHRQLLADNVRLRDEMRTLELALADRDARVSLLSQANHTPGPGARLDGLVTSPSTGVVQGLRRLAGRGIRRAAPQNTRRRESLRKARRASEILSAEGPSGLMTRINGRRHGLAGRPWSPRTPEDAQYALWLQRHEPSVAELSEMLVANSRWSYRPLISVVVPVYNPPTEWLDGMVGSVLGQSYTNWELCIADDQSPDPRVRRALERWAGLDARIRVTYREQNGNIAAASNTALDMARGEYVALLDHDDVLTPHALHRMVAALQTDKPADVLYSDEDKVLLNGDRGQVHFKGAFDPDYLLSTNYICHLSLFRRSLLTAIGGFRTGLDGSQDHDIALRATETAERVEHVADVLYSWKQVPGSAALDMSAKPAAWEAGRRAAEDALARRGVEGRVELGPLPGLLVARYPVAQCSVAVVVCTDDRGGLREILRRLRAGSGRNDLRMVIATHNAELSSLSGDGVTVVVGEWPVNQPQLLNRIVSTLDEDVVVLVGAGLSPSEDGGWLAPLLEHAGRDEVGAAGGRILAADGSVLEEGLRVGGPRVAESVGVRWPVIQRVGAVSANCLAVRRQVLNDVGGFDSRFRISLYDVDLCMRLRRRDLAVIYTPLTEFRRVTTTRDLGYGRDDAAVFTALWDRAPDADPYVSPWLERVQPLVIRTGD